MDFLSMVYTATSIIACGILIWFRTKSGKKWLKNL
jgi:hypothetical protein|nr:MAG TPA: hypothetical protein [Caudoviricetes sp.]